MHEEKRLIEVEYSLSIRTYNGLCNDFGSDALLGDIAKASDAELLRLPNFGKKSLHEFREYMGVPAYVSPRVHAQRQETLQRQKETYELKQQGLTFKKIAEKLNLSVERTRQRYHGYLRYLQSEEAQNEPRDRA